jgi:hypothetical protein
VSVTLCEKDGIPIKSTPESKVAFTNFEIKFFMFFTIFVSAKVKQLSGMGFKQGLSLY